MDSPLPRLDPDHLPPRVDPDDDAALARVRAVIAAGPFDDTWDSLRDYLPPRWYQDARFGIFLHWGVYSVPAFRSEWYSRTMYLEGTPEFEHHRATYGPQSEFGYKDFIPSLTMADFDPDAWASLFRRAGAQFVVPVAEHHDGFAMYDSGRTRWKASAMGPERDVLGDLLAAGQRMALTPGVSSHRAEHWFFMNGGARFDSDVLDPRFSDFYGPAQREETAPSDRYLQDWLLRCVELVDRYRPQVFWFDWWIEQPAFEPYLRMFAAYYYNRAAEWGLGVVINHKWDAFPHGTAVYDVERGALAGVRQEVWQNDTAVSRGAWCWVEGHDYKSAEELVCELVDVVAKNGVLLLNVGPQPDGTIPEAEAHLLEQIGRWLVRNGEAVYGSRPWTIAGEGPTHVEAGSFVDGEARSFTAEDVRFTTRHDVTGDYVYATLLGVPEDGVARIRAFGSGAGLLARGVQELSVLGVRGPVEWVQHPDHLEVRVPELEPLGTGPVVKLWLEPERVPPRRDVLHG